MTDVFAVVTRGLEAIAAEEMNGIPGVQVQGSAYRRVHAACAGALLPLLSLRTVDDVFVQAAVWEGILPQRQALPLLAELSRGLNLHQPLKRIARERPPEQANRFSVTANFVGRRNYTTDELKRILAEGIQAHYRWEYTPNDEDSQINVRLFIEHERAWVGLRIGARPLHRRAYKHSHLAGSLKPPVAAAMLRLVGLAPGMRLLDPLCGAGTIAIEAALMGARALGGDNDPPAVQAACANASEAGARLEILAWDALRLPLPDGSLERIVTNLPWGRQVPVGEGLSAFYRAACAEMERVLAPGGRVALLTSLPELPAFERLVLLSQTEVSVFGQNPVMMVWG